MTERHAGPSKLHRPSPILVSILALIVMATWPALGIAQRRPKPLAGNAPSAELLDEIEMIREGDRNEETAALLRMLQRLEHAFPTDPRKRPDLDLQRLLSHDGIRSPLLGIANRALSGDRRAEYLRGARIYQALGRADDLERFTQLVDHKVLGPFGEARNELHLGMNSGSLAHAMMEAGWTMVQQRGGDPWRASGELGAIVFVRAINERPDYRPKGWQERLAAYLVRHQGSPITIKYLLDQFPVPIPQPVHLDEHSILNPAVMITILIKSAANSDGRQTQRQIAALNLAARTRSLYFQPAIRNVLLETDDDAVRQSAQRALQACTRPKQLPAPGRVAKNRFDVVRADELLKRIAGSQAMPADFEHLRNLIGLDYGLDRDRWLRWWEQDQYGRGTSGKQGRPFVIQGRVLDAAGEPIVGATVSASPATYFSKFTYGGYVSGWTDTDQQGRFKVRFGMHKETREEFGVVPAVFRAGKKGLTITSFSSRPGRYLSEDEIAGDSVLRINESEILRPGIPLEIDFVMQPGVVLSAVVEDEQGASIDAKRILIRWHDAGPHEPGPVGFCKCCDHYSACHDLLPWNAPPGQQRYTSFDRHNDKRFHLPAMWAGVPREFAVELTRESSEPEVISDDVTFDQPGHYQLRLIVNKLAGTLRIVVESETEL